MSEFQSASVLIWLVALGFLNVRIVFQSRIVRCHTAPVGIFHNHNGASTYGAVVGIAVHVVYVFSERVFTLSFGVKVFSNLPFGERRVKENFMRTAPRR